jgi:hypothetical protein
MSSDSVVQAKNQMKVEKQAALLQILALFCKVPSQCESRVFPSTGCMIAASPRTDLLTTPQSPAQTRTGAVESPPAKKSSQVFLLPITDLTATRTDAVNQQAAGNMHCRVGVEYIKFDFS